jgi:hypothetical protein
MRSIRMFGLAAVAAIASMAFVGATAAHAEENPHPYLGFCLQNEGLLCNVTNVINPEPGGWLLVLAHANKAELKNTGFFKTPEVCESDTGVKVSSGLMEEKEKLKGEITELTFSNCSGPCTTATAVGLPWKNGELKMESATSDLKLISTEGGALLSGCTFGTKCEYGVPTGGNVTLLGENTLSGGVLRAEGVTLKYKSGSGEFVCGPTGTWTAEYVAKNIHLKNSKNEDKGLHAPWWFTLLG